MASNEPVCIFCGSTCRGHRWGCRINHDTDPCPACGMTDAATPDARPVLGVHRMPPDARECQAWPSMRQLLGRINAAAKRRTDKRLGRAEDDPRYRVWRVQHT